MKWEHGKILAILSLILIPIFAASLSGVERPLAEIYRSGKARLVPELVIDTNSLPKGVLFAGLVAISGDANGYIYVLDMSDYNVKKFDASGKFIKAIGRKGQGPGEFQMPSRMAIAGDRLVVFDFGSYRLTTLTLDGAPAKSVPVSVYDPLPYRMKPFRGRDLILETETTYYQPAGKPQDCRVTIADPDLNTTAEIYSGQILRDAYGIVPANLPQPYHADIQWDSSPSGLIVIGYSDKYELKILDADKKPVATISRSLEREEVRSEDKTRWFMQMKASHVPQDLMDKIVKATKFPRFKPAFDDVLWDPEGNILVHPVLEKEPVLTYDAFDPAGKFIARVEFAGAPPGFYALAKHVSGNYVWAVDVTEESEHRVVKWRIAAI